MRFVVAALVIACFSHLVEGRRVGNKDSTTMDNEHDAEKDTDKHTAANVTQRPEYTCKVETSTIEGHKNSLSISGCVKEGDSGIKDDEMKCAGSSKVFHSCPEPFFMEKSPYYHCKSFPVSEQQLEKKLSTYVVLKTAPGTRSKVRMFEIPKPADYDPLYTGDFVPLDKKFNPVAEWEGIEKGPLWTHVVLEDKKYGTRVERANVERVERDFDDNWFWACFDSEAFEAQSGQSKKVDPPMYRVTKFKETKKWNWIGWGFDKQIVIDGPL